jgi:hypothetical protein
VWDFLQKMAPAFRHVAEKGIKFRMYQTVRKQQLQGVPKTTMTYAHYNRNEAKVITDQGMSKYNRLKYSGEEWVKLYELTKADIQDVVLFHQRVHGETGRGCPGLHAEMSLDGIPETKSGGVSLDVLSIRFRSCR